MYSSPDCRVSSRVSVFALSVALALGSGLPAPVVHAATVRNAEDLLIVDLDVRAVFRKRLLDPRGRARTAPLPEVVVTDTNVGVPSSHARIESVLPPVREVYEALVLGTRDYVRKNGFSDVHIAISGGIDSAIVATIAVDALVEVAP